MQLFQPCRFLWLFSLIAVCNGRQVVFPPVAPVLNEGYSPLSSMAGDSPGVAFHGLTTFANLPYVQCFSDDPWGETYDLAILGAQFDTVGPRL